MVGRISRISFIAAMVGMLGLAFAPAAHAARNADAEQYVQTNATAALASLSHRGSSPEARQLEFGRLMTIFADVPRIANFVLGRYSPQLRANPQLRDQWSDTFRTYAMAVYEDQLDQYSAESFRVTGSIERIPGRDVVVQSQIVQNGRRLPVQWRILRNGAGWKVVDIALVLDGNEVWLAQQQQADFLAQLDRNRGDIAGLIAQVRQQTQVMRARIRARAA